MATELNSANELEFSQAAAAADRSDPPGGTPQPDPGPAPDPAPDTAPGEDSLPAEAGSAANAGPSEAALLAELTAAVREVADLSRRYHARAEQREGVIDHFRSEIDTLRRGERRGLLRPVLTEMCRLREDLLSQAETLPADFDAAKAADLLRSYAETLELSLENNGVNTYTPGNGDRFDPRLHRRVGGDVTTDPALAGHIAQVRRDGYLDIEANSTIAPAEVTIFAVRPAAGPTGASAPAAATPEGEQ